jgi:hypothetical protein
MDWSDPEVVGDAEAASWAFANLYCDNDGNLHVAYCKGEWNTHQELWYRMRHADGTWEDEVMLFGDGVADVVTWIGIAVDSYGEVHIVFNNIMFGNYTGEDGNMGILYYIHGAGQFWSEAEVFRFDETYEEAVPDSYCTAQTIAIDDNNTLYCAFTSWHYDADGDWMDRDLFLYAKPYDGNWELASNCTPENEPDEADIWPGYSHITKDIYDVGPGIAFDISPEETDSWIYYVQPLLSGIEDGDLLNIPGAVALKQNYPNPFNPSTEIGYTVLDRGNVELNVYDAAGKLVKTLVNGSKEANSYTVVWDGTDNAGQTVSSGVYVYTIKVGDYSESKSMILLK